MEGWSNYGCAGLVNANSGKTLAAAVEIARAVCGADPYGKYTQKDGRVWAVGEDQTHVSDIMYPKLTRAGAFKMVKDEVTGDWRAFRPWADAHRKHEARKAPPLIPPRLIADVAWEKKKERLPAVLYLTTGWEVRFFSSMADPTKGADIDLAWIDEEILNDRWFAELMARLLDRSGVLVWSATPEAGTEKLFELHEKAAKERADFPAGPWSVEEFKALLSENRHLPEKDKEEFAQSLSEEERRVKVLGEFLITSFRVYPEYADGLHGIDLESVPPHWTRYAVVDPGHQVCAVLFAAVPPPDEGDFVLLYDELYVRECSAAKFAEAMAHKAQHQDFECFLMDAHMAVHTELGVGRAVGAQYAEELERLGVRSRQTGHSFKLASDDVDAGVLAVKGMLRPRGDGTPRLRVRRGWMPNFEYEIKRYHRKRVAGVVTDKPDNRRDNHLMDCLRYLALYGAPYVRPRERKSGGGAAVKALKAKKQRAAARDSFGPVHLGATGTK